MIALIGSELSDMMSTARRTLSDNLFRAIEQLIESPKKKCRIAATILLREFTTPGARPKLFDSPHSINVLFRLLPAKEHRVSEQTATAIGQIVAADETLPQSIIDVCFNQAIELVKAGRKFSPFSQVSGTLLFKHLSEAAPHSLHKVSRHFPELFWGLLTSSKEAINAAAMEAFPPCLQAFDDVARCGVPLRELTKQMFGLAWQGLHASATKPILAGIFVLSKMLRVDISLRKEDQAFGTSAYFQRQGGARATIASSQFVEFMREKYIAVCDALFNLLSSKNREVTFALARALPVIALFDPEIYKKRYLEKSVLFLLSKISLFPKEVALFEDIGWLFYSVRWCPLASYVDTLVGGLKSALLTPKTKKEGQIFSEKALNCIHLLIIAMPAQLLEYVPHLLEAMFSKGLTKTLVAVLKCITQKLPSLTSIIQFKLLNEISLTLVGLPLVVQSDASVRKGGRRQNSMSSGGTTSGYEAENLQVSHMSDFNCFSGLEDIPRKSHIYALGHIRRESFERPELLPPHFITPRLVSPSDKTKHAKRKESSNKMKLLALKTLYGFDFKEFQLLNLIAETVTGFLNSPYFEFRKAATKVLTKLALHPHANALELRGGPLITVTDILTQLTFIAVADKEPSVRNTVIRGFDSRYDIILAQDSNLKPLLLLLNDENMKVKQSAIELVGRLTLMNPAFTMPSIRKMLSQLLSSIRLGVTPSSRIQAAKFLSCLIRSCQKHIKPYTKTILGSLLKELEEQSSEVVIALFTSISEIAKIDGDVATKSIPTAVPIALDIIKSKGSFKRRNTALKMLTVLSRETGLGPLMFQFFPESHSLIVSLIRDEENKKIRISAIKLLGVLGAHDPERVSLLQYDFKKSIPSTDNIHKIVNSSPQLSAVPGNRLVRTSLALNRPHLTHPTKGMNKSCIKEEKLCVVAALEYTCPVSDPFHYSLSSTLALLKILKDSSLSTHHLEVVSSLVTVVCKTSNDKQILLAHVVPELLGFLGSSKQMQLQEVVLKNVRILINSVKELFVPYLKTTCRICQQLWSIERFLPLIFSIVHEIGNSLSIPTQQYLHLLIPNLLTTIEGKKESLRKYISRAFSCLKNFSPILDEYLTLIIPILLKYVERGQHRLENRLHALQTLESLVKCCTFVDHASYVIHSLIRIIASAYSQIPSRKEKHPLTTKYEKKFKRIGNASMDVMCTIVLELKGNFAIFIPLVSSTMRDCSFSHERYEEIVSCILLGVPTDMVQLPPIATSSRGNRIPFPKEDSESSRPDDSSEGARPYYAKGSRRTPSCKETLFDLKEFCAVWKGPPKGSLGDWRTWLSNACRYTLSIAPEAVLSVCAGIASSYYPLARDLLNSSFTSCFRNLKTTPERKEVLNKLCQNIELQSIPVEVLQTILDLIEFLWHDASLENSLSGLDFRFLANASERCNAFAKALRFREMSYRTNPRETVKHLISINNHLNNYEAAKGIMVHTRRTYGSQLNIKEQCFEQLQQWDEALALYEASPKCNSEKYILARLRCLAALEKHNEILSLVKSIALDYGDSGMFFFDSKGSIQSTPLCKPPLAQASASESSCLQANEFEQKLSFFASEAALNLQQYSTFDEFSSRLLPSTLEGSYYHSIRELLRGKYLEALSYIKKARKLLDPQLVVLMSESYNRSYQYVVLAQELEELENIVQLKMKEHRRSRATKATSELLSLRRLYSVSPRSDVWHRLLRIRSLMYDPDMDVSVYIYYNSLKRNEMKYKNVTLKNSSLYDNEDKLTVSLTIRDGEIVSDCVSSAKSLDSTPRWLQHIFATPRFGAIPHQTFCFLKENWTTSSNILSKFNAFLHLLKLADDITKQVKSNQRFITESKEYENLDPPNVLLAKILLRLTIWFDIITKTNINAEAPEKHELHIHGTPIPAPLLHEVGPDLESRDAIKKGVIQACNYFSKKPQNCDLPFSCRYKLPWLETGTEVAPEMGDVWVKKAIALEQKITHLSEHGPDEGEPVSGDLNNAIKDSLIANFHAINTNNPEMVIPATLRLLGLWFKYGEIPEIEEEVQKGFEYISLDVWLEVIPQLIARFHVESGRIGALLHRVLLKVGLKHPHALVYPLAVAARTPSEKDTNGAWEVLQLIRRDFPEVVEQVLTVSNELIRIGVLWPEMWIEAIEIASHAYFKENNVKMMLETLAPLHEKLAGSTDVLTPAELAFQTAWRRQLDSAFFYCRRFALHGDHGDIQQAWSIYYDVFQALLESVKKLRSLDMSQVSPVLCGLSELDLSAPGSYIAGRPVVRIAEFNPVLTVIMSKQRPRQLTLYGSDGARYVYLLKGHEDNRLDERVMQLLGLVNLLLSTNLQTARHDLTIIRYAAVPLSPQSGVLSWVPNTRTLHALVIDYRRKNSIPDTLESDFIHDLVPMFDSATITQKLQALLTVRENCSNDDIQKILWLQAESSEEWLERRTAFTRSLAVMSMVGYMLGLGDRHPSNLLMYGPSGKIMHIDYGDCFEVAMHRYKYPELIPFRLTPMLVNAMEVSGVEGNFRSTCEATMRLLRNNSDSFMVMLEAFLHDPLNTWSFVRKKSPEPPEPSAGRLQALTSGIVRVPDAEKFQAAELNVRAVKILRRVLSKLMGTDFKNHPFLTVSQQVHVLIERATNVEALCQCYSGWLPMW